MLTKWIVITFIGSFIGISISIKALIDLFKMIKKLKELDDEQEFSIKKYKLSMLKFGLYAIIGISVTSISALVRIFLR